MAPGDVTVQDSDISHEEVRDVLLHSLEQERCQSETFRHSLSTNPESDKQFANLEVAGLCEAALEEANVGGDFYDAFALNAGKVALVLGDVCGKGLQAALYTDQLKHTVRAYLRESPNPTQALTRLNRFVCDAQRLDELGNGAFTVMTLAVVDPASGDTVLSTAGAEPPLLLRRSGDTEAVTTVGKLPLGIEIGEVYGATSLRLEPDDTLLLATDGITEARQGRDFLGYEGMTALAQEARSQGSLKQCAEAILTGAKHFAGGVLHDDACVLLARRKSLILKR